MTFPDILLSVGNTINKMFNNYIISLSMALLVCWDVCWFDGFSTSMETKGKSQVLKQHQQMEAIQGTLMHTLDSIIIDHWKTSTLRSHRNTIIKAGCLDVM